jgi:hypothetical protein
MKQKQPTLITAQAEKPGSIGLVMVNKSAEALKVFQDVETPIFIMLSGDGFDSF